MFSSAIGTFTYIGHILSDKPQQFKRIEIIQMFSLHIMKSKWKSWTQSKWREIRKYFEVEENENTTYQNLWDSAKALFQGKFIEINAYIWKEKRSQVSSLRFHIKN